MSVAMQPPQSIPPSMLIGANRPGEGKVISAEANEIINRIREHYKSQGKSSAAHNYSRHLKSFFAWAEASGYEVTNLPVDAVESFLASLGAAGQKETTLYVMRTQLKSALKECGNALGLEVGHIEYQTGKPSGVRRVQKEKEKRQRAEKRLVQTAQQLQAIRAAQTAMFGTAAGGDPNTPYVISAAPAPAAMTPVSHSFESYDTNALPTEAPDASYPSETPMNDQSVPQPAGPMHNGAAQSAPQPIVINMPAQTGRPTTTIGQAQAQQARQSASQPQRGVVLNNHTFNGPYVRISYIADGSSVIPAGSEVALRVYPASQLAPHGDIATFLQSYVIPEMRLHPSTAQVSFVFHELNDKKQPTGRRDEMVVSVLTSAGAGMGAAVSTTPAPMQMGSYGPMMPQAPMPQNDSMTSFLIQKLDREAEEAKKRAEAVQEEMKKASDAQTTFMLMQNFQREQELRREIEERRMREIERVRAEATLAAAPMPTPVPPMPFPVAPEPQNNGTAEIAKAMNESQTRMMELMLAAMNRPQPVAPPPPAQKDVSEWLIPFIAQMNQQAQAQAQAQQQMMMQQQNQTVQILQAMLTRENPMEKILLAQLQEVKAAANAPKADELESFADKLQKMKMVSDMLGGNSGPGFLSELLANADTIGAGAAKVIAAAKTQPPAGLAGMKGAAAPTSQTPALPAATGPQPITAPAEALTQLQYITEGVDSENPQQVVNGVVEYLKVMLSQPEDTPFPTIGRRLLSAFQNAEDEGELFTFVKNLWKQVGATYERHVVKNVAGVLAHWYTEIHEQLFGEPRSLPGYEADEVEGAEGDGDEAGGSVSEDAAEGDVTAA